MVSLYAVVSKSTGGSVSYIGHRNVIHYRAYNTTDNPAYVGITKINLCDLSFLPLCSEIKGLGRVTPTLCRIVGRYTGIDENVQLFDCADDAKKYVQSIKDKIPFREERLSVCKVELRVVPNTEV